MNIVIQCAAGKQPHAGHLKTRTGKRVLFIAQPEHAPREPNLIYARPDDASDSGTPWRELALAYNADPRSNPLGLLPAYKLYRHPAYARLVERFSPDRIFILSAGWGLISSSFLTPAYDITFSASADRYKRRKQADVYEDFCMLPEGSTEDIYFFGGKDYVPLFCRLSAAHRGQTLIFYNSASAPQAPGCTLRRYQTTTRTNWHYECADAVLRGKIELE